MILTFVSVSFGTRFDFATGSGLLIVDFCFVESADCDAPTTVTLTLTPNKY